MNICVVFLDLSESIFKWSSVIWRQGHGALVMKVEDTFLINCPNRLSVTSNSTTSFTIEEVSNVKIYLIYVLQSAISKDFSSGTILDWTRT